MSIIKKTILPLFTSTIALSSTCCSTLKTEHHITLNHNIKVEIEASTITNVFDRWETLNKTHDKYIELYVNNFVDDLYSSIE